VGKQVVQAQAREQMAVLVNQLADVKQSIDTEIANHKATMAPLRLQEQSLEGRIGFLDVQRHSIFQSAASCAARFLNSAIGFKNKFGKRSAKARKENRRLQWLTQFSS